MNKDRFDDDKFADAIDKQIVEEINKMITEFSKEGKNIHLNDIDAIIEEIEKKFSANDVKIVVKRNDEIFDEFKDPSKDKRYS